MYNSISLPVLPWFNFDRKVGYDKWHRCTKFDFLNGEIRYLVQQRQPQALASKPFPWDPPTTILPLYPTKPHPELPSWLIYDKHVLCFEAYFQETLIERNMETIFRRVKIVYFLEDGTVQVNEAKVENSGLSQGTLINRQRIPFARPNDRAYHEVIDFNIGKKVVLFGRVFHIYNCDKFTRQWLNKSGIAVPDPITPPKDQFTAQLLQRKSAMSGKRPHAKSHGNLRQFLDFDRHVLRFYGYWDDRASEGGELHKIVLQYYLADDTIEIREQGRGHFNVVRGRLPKESATLPGPGAKEPVTLLNVLDNRVTTDCLNIGANQIKYYEDCDLSIGTCLNVYGRAVILTSCDTFTKEYYKAKYGLETFGEPIPYPGEESQKLVRTWSLPPWNGFGTFEDSARNCVRIVPKREDFSAVAKKLENSSNGLDSRILRFYAVQVPEDETSKMKHYIICFYLADDTVSIFQEAERNSGYPSCFVFLRREAMKPTDNLFVSMKPETYTKEDFWVGNHITVEGNTYHLIQADEYAMRYMELNNQEFPKSNIDLILPKIREKLRPIYKSFVCKYLLPDGENTISQEQLWMALLELFDKNITPQEMLTVARHFAVPSQSEGYNKDVLRDICRNECRRLLFVGQDRLSENLHYRDMRNTGFLPKGEAYSICRGAHVPLEQEVLKHIINSHVEKNEVGDVKIDDLLSFFDPAGLPTCTYVPLSHQREFSEFTLLAKKQDYSRIDSMRLLERLGLEENLMKES